VQQCKECLVSSSTEGVWVFSKGVLPGMSRRKLPRCEVQQEAPFSAEGKCALSVWGVWDLPPLSAPAEAGCRLPASDAAAARPAAPRRGGRQQPQRERQERAPRI